MNERLQHLRDQIEEQYEALSARDQALALALVVGVALVAALGFSWFLHGIIEDRGSRVRSAKADLTEAMELAVEHQRLQAKISAAESQMGEFRPSHVNTYLEGWADEAGVGAGLRVQEVGSEVVGLYKERTYRVNVQRAELSGVVKFLLKIENSKYPIRIKNSTFRAVDAREARFLDLSLELVTFAKEGGTEG